MTVFSFCRSVTARLLLLGRARRLRMYGAVSIAGLLCAVVVGLSTANSAFAENPICPDANVTVAPGGSVKVPVDCYNTVPFDNSNYYVEKSITVRITTKGSLFDGAKKLSLASPSIDKSSKELLYKADKTVMGVDDFQFLGQVFETATGKAVLGGYISRPPGTGTIAIDPTGTTAPKCDDVTATVKAGETVDVPTSCVGPMGILLKLAIASKPTHGKTGIPDDAKKIIPYTADTTYSGKDTFTYNASTPTQTSNDATATITVTPRTNPKCDDVTATVQAGETVDVPTKCVDPAGKALTLAVASNPTHGKTGTPDNAKATIPYTADKTYVGADRFTYHAANGTETSNDANAAITVTARPLPRCDDVSATVEVGGTVDVPAKCVDPAGKALTFAVATNPAHGKTGVVDNARKVIPYTPDAGYVGPDTFTYNASNGTDTSNNANATITVTRKPDVTTTTTTTTTTPPPPPPTTSDPTAPVCRNVTKRIEIPWPEVDEKDHLIGGDPWDPKIPHPLNLDCSGMDGAVLSYKLLETKKWGTLEGLNPATGKVDWHNVNWDELEKEACPSKHGKCDESKLPKFKNHPEDIPEDPNTHLPTVDTFYYGFDELYHFRAVDETHNLVSNDATLNVQYREGQGCRVYKVGQLAGTHGDDGVIALVRCVNKDGKWESMEDPKNPSPFTGESAPSPASCTALTSGGRTPRTLSRWVRATSKSRIQVQTPGVVSRSSKGMVTFSARVKGRKQVFPKPPKAASGPEDSAPQKPYMDLGVQIDGYDVGSYKKRNRLPVVAKLDPATLKPGRHQFTVLARKVTPPKNGKGRWKEKTKKIVSLSFTVVNCEPAKLAASQARSRTTVKATSGNAALTSATFTLPKKLGSRVTGVATQLKVGTGLRLKLKRVKKLGKKPVVLARKNGVTVTVQGKKITVKGLPEKVSSLTLLFSKAHPTKSPLYRAVLSTGKATVSVSTRLYLPKKRKK